MSSKVEEELSNWSDEDLEKERIRLLEELQAKKKEKNKKERGHGLDEQEK